MVLRHERDSRQDLLLGLAGLTHTCVQPYAETVCVTSVWVGMALLAAPHPGAGAATW